MMRRFVIPTIFGLFLAVYGCTVAQADKAQSTADKIHNATTQGVTTVGQTAGVIAASSPPGSPLQFWAGTVAALAGTMLALDKLLYPLVSGVIQRLKKPDPANPPTAPPPPNPFTKT